MLVFVSRNFYISKQHLFGFKRVTVYRVEIPPRTMDRAVDIVYMSIYIIIYIYMALFSTTRGVPVDKTSRNVFTKQLTETKMLNNYEVT